MRAELPGAIHVPARPATRVLPGLRAIGTGLAAAVVLALVVAVPTDLLDTPLFSRAIPPTWWAWPSLVVSSLLGGALVATYVNPAVGGPDRPADAPTERRGLLAGLLTFFAVGCPVCNKLVLVALGSAGAVTWFAPFQPLLQLLAIALLVWALVSRLRGSDRCAVRGPAPTPTPTEDSR